MEHYYCNVGRSLPKFLVSLKALSLISFLKSILLIVLLFLPNFFPMSTVSFEEGFSRDVTNIGHWGCGAVELYLQSSADFEKAKSLIDRAFDEN